MSDLEKIREEFDKQRQEIINNASKEKSTALEELQLKAEKLNEEYQGRTDLDEYIDKKEVLNEDYKKALALIELNKQKQLSSLEKQENEFFKYLNNDELISDEMVVIEKFEDKIKKDEEINLIITEQNNLLNKIANKKELEHKKSEDIKNHEIARVQKEREEAVAQLESQYASLTNPKSIVFNLFTDTRQYGRFFCRT